MPLTACANDNCIGKERPHTHTHDVDGTKHAPTRLVAPSSITPEIGNTHTQGYTSNDASLEQAIDRSDACLDVCLITLAILTHKSLDPH